MPRSRIKGKVSAGNIAKAQKTVDHPLCRFEENRRPHDARFFDHLREKVIAHVLQHLDLIPQFPVGALTVKKLEALTMLLDETFFENQLLALVRSQSIQLKYCVSHKPQEEYSAIIFYEGPMLRICVNTARYENVVGRNNNGIRIRHRLENLIVDICHEMIHLLLYACTGEIKNDEEAHKGAFAIGNKHFFNHTKTYYQEADR